jgi:hypothetical protein
MHVFRSLKKDESFLVVYPNSYNYTYNSTINGTTSEITSSFNNGSFINLKPESISIKDPNNRNYFKFLQTNTTVEFGKSKALYDMNIAVLKIERSIDGRLTDLTYESDHYCTALSTYLGKFTQCLNRKSYEEYIKIPGNLGRTIFMYVDEIDIDRSNFLFLDQSKNRFGILIIPDIVMGAEKTILDILGESGINKIKTFVNNGGMIYVSGKSAILLEDPRFNFIKQNIIDKDNLLVSTRDYVFMNGCNDVAKMTDSSELTFIKKNVLFFNTCEFWIFYKYIIK